MVTASFYPGELRTAVAHLDPAKPVMIGLSKYNPIRLSQPDGASAEIEYHRCWGGKRVKAHVRRLSCLLELLGNSSLPVEVSIKQGIVTILATVPYWDGK